jgi:hypothetical protein
MVSGGGKLCSAVQWCAALSTAVCSGVPALGQGPSSRLTRFVHPAWLRPPPPCTALHCTALHCTALHCTALHCTTSGRRPPTWARCRGPVNWQCVTLLTPSSAVQCSAVQAQFGPKHLCQQSKPQGPKFPPTAFTPNDQGNHQYWDICKVCWVETFLVISLTWPLCHRLLFLSSDLKGLYRRAPTKLCLIW